MNRRRIKPKSSKRAKHDQEHEPLKEAFRSEFPRCWVCHRAATDIHHIAGKLQGDFDSRANWLRACKDCHLIWTDNKWQPFLSWKGSRKEWGVLVALAYKQLRDPQHYDRLTVLAVLGRGPECITELEVSWEIKAIRDHDRRERGFFQ